MADEDRELTPSELRKIMINREYEDNWENIATNETLVDVDDSILKRFFELATDCSRLPQMNYNKEILLEKLGVYRNGFLTNAGRMLFSKNAPITLKMAVFATEHKETFLDMATVNGNIFTLIDEEIKYIIKNIRWGVKLSDDGIHRDEIPEIPVEVLREAVINSYTHARYDISVQHEIDVFSDRVAITNPGSFANDYLPIDFYTKDLHSYLRNETISKVLYLCKDIESFGSGLRKIYSLCHEGNVTVSFDNQETYFTLLFSRKDRNENPDGTINGTINALETEILSLLMGNRNMTINELTELTGKSERTVKRVLSSLKSKKLIERIGSNKNGYWKT